MECEKIMELFHSELVTVNVGPRLFATALEQQGYRTVQVLSLIHIFSRMCALRWTGKYRMPE